jgi:AcrR family transcriptional regulator
VNQERWNEILATSARLFKEKGYRATAMEDIAKELHITKPALYYYIRSKHDLLYAICDEAISQLMQGLEQVRGSDAPPDKQLQELMRWQVNMFSRFGDFTNVYLANEGELEPVRRDYVRERSRDYEHFYREVLEEGMRRGTFRNLDVHTVVRAISGMCNWLSAWYREEGKMSADDIADIFFDLVIGGLKPPAKGGKS